MSKFFVVSAIFGISIATVMVAGNLYTPELFKATVVGIFDIYRPYIGGYIIDASGYVHDTISPFVGEVHVLAIAGVALAYLTILLGVIVVYYTVVPLVVALFRRRIFLITVSNALTVAFVAMMALVGVLELNSWTLALVSSVVLGILRISEILARKMIEEERVRTDIIVVVISVIVGGVLVGKFGVSILIFMETILACLVLIEALFMLASFVNERSREEDRTGNHHE